MSRVGGAEKISVTPDTKGLQKATFEHLGTAK